MDKPILQSFWAYIVEQTAKTYSIHDQIQILESTIKDYQNPLDSPITLNEATGKNTNPPIPKGPVVLMLSSMKL